VCKIVKTKNYEQKSYTNSDIGNKLLGVFKMKKTIFAIFITVVSLLILFSACSTSATSTTAQQTTPAKATTPTTSATQSTVAPQSGGALKIINRPGIVNIGAPGQMTSSVDMQLARPCVESLVGFDPKGTGLPVPALASSWQLATDYSSITFTLRKGVKFHDGTDFNATAAKFNLDLVRNSSLPDLKAVTSVDVIDDYTIKLNLSKYNPAFLNALVGPTTWMVSPTAYQSMGVDTAKLHPVGTGPFKFVSYERDVSLKYQKFADYWKKGQPYVDSMEFVLISDTVTSLMSLKAGEAQVLTRLAAKDASDLKTSGKYNVITSIVGLTGLAGDSAHSTSPFSDIKVRQAIAYAINKDAISKSISYGMLPVANQIVPPGANGYNSAIVGYPYDPQKATALLAQAGYSNFKTKIMYDSGTSSAMEFYTAIQGFLGAVGIDVQLQPVDRGLYAQTTSAGWNNQMVAISCPSSIGYDFGTALTLYISKTSAGYNSNSLYIPDDYQAKLDLAVVERDTQKRTTMLQELSKIIIDQYCMLIPIWDSCSLVASVSQVHDLDFGKYSSNDWSPENVWISK
jgi:peptide/nickel transport system substrate-binding protein